LHSPDGVGVLRDVVQAWFAHGGRQFVSGWKWAGKKEGGSGVIVARLSVAAGTREQ
jgi:DNA-nicking Smr family endonuclease